MKLLLDTHIWIWSLGPREKLATQVARELVNPDNEFYLSPLSVYELIGMHAKGRFVPDQPFALWLKETLEEAPLREAPLTTAVAIEACEFQLPHGDPIDKLLVATARVFELTLVTADRALIRSRAVSVLPNR